MIQIKNGTIQIKALTKAVLDEHYGRKIEKVKDPIHEIIAECQNIIHPDRCALGIQLKDCLDKSSIFHRIFQTDHGIFI